MSQALELLNSKLDTYPEDSTLRLLYAQELFRVGNPLWEGYKVLGELGRYPFWCNTLGHTSNTWIYVRYITAYERELEPSLLHNVFHRYLDQRLEWSTGWAFTTRKEAEDYVAEVWTKLSPEQKTLILESYR